MIKVNYERCTGCEACVQKCPKQCISMVKGEFGFLYPEIDYTRCVNCDFCESVCPIEKPIFIPENQQVYAAVHKDPRILNNSTSGGAFSALSETVLINGGVVYGVTMEKFNVHHARIQSTDELNKFRGSKYLQSRIGTVFKDVEKDLKSGKEVLFSGTPCQIDGLKQFLKKDYVGLFTIDIVCHGVGSQAYFDKYLTTLTEKWPSLKELKFRSKRFAGWSCSAGAVIIDDKGEIIEKPLYCHESYYYQFFLKGDIYRKSCYFCKYANMNRLGDVTLGDFWGVEQLGLSIDTYHGCSLVIVNTEKGRQLIKRVDNLALEMVSAEDAIKHNNQLNHPSPLRKKRVLRLLDYETKSGSEIASRYFRNEWKSVLKGNIKKLIPYSIKVVVRQRRL